MRKAKRTRVSKAEERTRFKVYWATGPAPPHPKDCFGCEAERIMYEATKRALSAHKWS